MFKYILMITMLPAIAMAHVSKCPHYHRPDGKVIWQCDDEGLTPNPRKIFTATGRICRGPSYDQGGEPVTSHRGYAEQLTDQAASKQCYPFQYKREGAYHYRNTNEECPSTNSNAIRETVTAEYSCASL